MKYKKIKKEFSDWGKQCRQMPNSNETLQQKIMIALEKNSQAKIRGPISLWRFSFALGAMALALILFVNLRPDYPQPIGSIPVAIDYSNQESEKTANQTSPASISYDGKEISSPEIGISYGQYTSGGSGSSDSIQSKIARWIQPAPSSDTREFLKTGFGANFKTRQVQKLTQRIQTAIRGHKGRIDYSSINEKYANISFVIPKSSFYAFKDEIQDYVKPRFYSESQYSQNLLTQKRAIETGTNIATSTKADLQKQLTNLTDAHNKTVAEIKKQLDNFSYNIYLLNSENTTNTVRLAQIKSSLNYYYGQTNLYNQKLKDAIAQYDKNKNSLNQKIQAQDKQLADLQTQDSQLMNEVETVEGSITIAWVSVFDIIEIYIPYYKTLIGLLVAVLVILMFYVRPRSLDI
ncbi:MAG: hypothetical protein COU31_02285 [Candidatus Magasanikbacteria bacterium CG10_big_fil_rev_8_21_14_0_10_40_10]|uniref:Uncharacterized protein n=1 Tax=Candidatus Magasanikbacteria bacterium CG10_big_fil_rev_8_21_14_0_10_40_10 TaxID=1974648 RepID=A0A2M6W425_9BACT|nr:MAG: hypothetical protein COU31_02285 [Candidatus Magasanikbacteria bacterium CG10_big_fil_rev_8_21_14_0_10_40_10]